MAAIILTTTIGLVFGTIANTRQPVVQSGRKLRAATYAQRVLDALRGRVNDNTWKDPNGLLTNGEHNLNAVSDVPCPTGVGGTYTITDVDGYKKVTAKVTYNDAL